eukprot:CAMPEP_0116941544 /NCGR_PEP_ID=MMETSP0467-20121206/34048_1 /TAXON_ID=283647 /ORGANISM="Mesodinium pulex, Strain SPMC105" /LENGTH=152 /DNA_ID=CAMNT_0004624341 /DNA_START=2027 /DNA_END=2485 /DNA_ORIENTATION=-
MFSLKLGEERCEEGRNVGCENVKKVVRDQSEANGLEPGVIDFVVRSQQRNDSGVQKLGQLGPENDFACQTRFTFAAGVWSAMHDYEGHYGINDYNEDRHQRRHLERLRFAGVGVLAVGEGVFGVLQTEALLKLVAVAAIGNEVKLHFSLEVI